MQHWLSTNRHICRAILEHLDTPLSLSIWLQIENEEWDQLSIRWLDPQLYPEGIFSALKYRKDVQAVDLLRKAPLPTTLDRRDAALAAWHAAETQCYMTNERMIHLSSSPSLTRGEASFSEFLGKVKKRMGRILGRLPDDLSGGFGPGTCVEYKGSNPTVVDKLWLTPTTTPEASALFEHFFFLTHWGQERLRNQLPLPSTSRGNRFTTVPKDGKTDRPISIEPLGNLWLQLGIGRYLKRRLRQVGLPIFSGTERVIFPGLSVFEEDAQTVHRRLIREGRSRAFSTIDLSSASDTLATEFIRLVTPDEWFELLDCCRSKITSIPFDGKVAPYHLEKFSSMGNGFTFEFETLVFMSVLSVAFDLTPGENLWVFGDDIILPEVYFDEACAVLRLCGFTPNLRKSFKQGPFRESCGGNVHTDIEVTPVRITSTIDGVDEWYAFHNALRRWGFPPHVLRAVRRRIPKQHQFPGPNWLGDNVLHLPTYPSKLKDGIRWVKTLRMQPTVQIPLERWSPELAVTAVILGVPNKVVRRGTSTVPMATWASIS